MTGKWIKWLLAAGLILVLAIPASAAEEKKCGPGTKRDELIEKVQKGLSGKGYDPQGVDGKCGDKTLKAMNRFQRDNGLKETPWPDEPTLKKLLTPVEGVAAKTEQQASGESAQVHIDSIYPTTVYPSVIHKRYDFEISGQNLAAKADNNIVEVIDKGPELMGIAEECAAAKKSGIYNKPCLEVDKEMETRKLRVVGFQPDKYKGPVQIRIRVGPNVSNALPVTFAAYSQQAVFLMALAVFAILAWIVVRLMVWKGIGYYEIDGKKYGPLASFLLDKQTDSYSLSKFQLLAWTTVAIFGYLYLFLCRVLIQWNFQWPSIPDGLPVLLGISAGTTVAAAGITGAIGSKGAGAVKPSMADFISIGGLVISERFQFFVWTLVGCLGFIFLLIRTDPSTLTDLPKVPDNFLYLMGISSAGYLGGKAVRKAGPVIKTVSVAQITLAAPLPPEYQQPAGVTVTYPVLTIKLKGENFDPKAKLKIDGKPIERADQFWIAGTPDPQSNFCTEMCVSLNDASTYLENEHTLTLVNSDAQAADVKFPVDPMSIDSVADTPNGAGPVDVTVKGKNFGEQMSAEWRNPAEATAFTPIPPADIKKVSAAELIVRLIPGQKGTGKLTLVSAVKLRASKVVTIT